MAVTCKHVKPDGSRCGAYPLSGEEYCVWHHPDKEETRVKMRKKAGFMAAHKPLPPSELPDLDPEDEVDVVIPVLQRAVKQLEGMKPSPSTMATLGNVASALDRALERRANRGADITTIEVVYVNDWRSNASEGV